MKPTSLKTWDKVKDLRYDLSNILGKGKPEEYLYQESTGVHYPACKAVDIEMIPESTIRIFRREKFI